MALDAAVLSLVVRELRERAVGSRIDRISQPSRDEIVLTLRSREGTQRLLLSCQSGCARVSLTEEKFENPQVPPSFCMLLRKYLSGGRLDAVRSVQGERIACFDFGCTNEMGESVTVTLAAELMGRYANLIVIGRDGVILDALKRINLDASSVRPILPGLRYELPAAQKKPDFFALDDGQFLSAVCASGLSCADAVQKAVGGIGPAVCRELAFRAVGQSSAPADSFSPQQRNALAREAAALRLAYAGGGSPTLVLGNGGEPVEFSFVPLRQYLPACMLESCADYCGLLDRFYAEKDRRERLRQQGHNLTRTIQNLYGRARRKQAARLAEEAAGENAEISRIRGELIQANMYSIPRGAREITVSNYYDGSRMTIPLDVRLSAPANAQKYFKEYKKKQTAARILKQLLAEGQREIDYLETVLYEVNSAAGQEELAEIRSELGRQGYIRDERSPRAKQKPSDFLRLVSSDGFPILIGRSNEQNDRLTLHTARGCDLWFHVKNAPGSHTVVVTGGKQVPQATMNEAAMLAVRHSSLDGSSKVPVDYTAVRNIRKPGGFRPGMVLYEKYETAFVTPDPAVLGRVKADTGTTGIPGRKQAGKV